MPAAFIVICVEKAPDANPWKETVYLADCAIASQNIMLAAHEMGIGSCVAISYAKVAIKEILNLPDDVEPLLMVTLGYPAEAPEPPGRLKLNQIAFMDEYGKEWPS
jgi:nitroreductase